MILVEGVIEVIPGQDHVQDQDDAVGGPLIQVLADPGVAHIVLHHMTLDLVLVHIVGLVLTHDVTDLVATVVILRITVVQGLGHHGVILAQGQDTALIQEVGVGRHTTQHQEVDPDLTLAHIRGRANAPILILHILVKKV